MFLADSDTGFGFLSFSKRWGCFETESVDRELSGEDGGVVISCRRSWLDVGGGEVGVGSMDAKMVCTVLSPLLLV